MDLLNEFIRMGDETVLQNLDKYIYDYFLLQNVIIYLN